MPNQSPLAVLAELSPRLVPGDCRSAAEIRFSAVFLLNSNIGYFRIIRGIMEQFWVLRGAGRGWGNL